MSINFHNTRQSRGSSLFVFRIKKRVIISIFFGSDDRLTGGSAIVTQFKHSVLVDPQSCPRIWDSEEGGDFRT